MKEGEKLPYKIKESLEKGKIIEKEWNNNKLNSSINDCLNIENNIKDIKIINENIKKNNINIKFNPEENGIKYFIDIIKKFGNIYYNKYSFLKCPNDVKENRKFKITGKKDNIFTKIGGNGTWIGTICENQLDNSKEEHIWKIKILNTQNYHIMVGIATIDFDFNSASYQVSNNFGWYYYCNDGDLYSGPPHNYQYKNIKLKYKKNEITIIMNMNKKTLKFIIDNEDKGESYIDIPLDKPISPSVLLNNENDSVEIIEM